MKTIKLVPSLLTVFLLSAVPMLSQNQPFHKGNWIVEAGIGFGNYSTNLQTQTTFINSGQFNAGPLSAISSGGATEPMGSIIIPLKIEYAISDRFGVGLKFGQNNFLVNKDDFYNTSSIRSRDFGVRINFHFNTNEENDVFIELILGSSNIKWFYNDYSYNNLSSLKGRGDYLSLGFNDRFYFTDHIGLLLYFSITRYYYQKLTPTYTPNPQAQTNPSFTNQQTTIDYINFDVIGINFGTGIAVKF
ncbi:MAG: porin family protein [Vicingaceae bacterium]|nr:porin family protein [Vicingaceae bacterium]